LPARVRQGRLIDALLTLASSQRGLDRRERFDLAEITRTAIRNREREAGARDLRVVADLAAAPADGDPGLAESLVANLVDNALRHNVRGGRIDIRTGPSADAETGAAAASMSVSNTGAVIPPGELDRLFQPFQPLGRERIRRSGAPAGTASAWPSFRPSSPRTARRSPPRPVPAAASTSL
jgi:signal transduction histidine kinase